MDDTNRHKPLYNIKRAAEMSGVSPNLIRAYERMGLMRPYRDPDNNYRLFTEFEVEWIARVKALINDVGLNIEGIKCLLTISPCWEDRDCDPDVRENCPAYRQYNFPCWCVDEDKECCDRTNACYCCEHYIRVRNHPKLRLRKKKRE